jgi:nitrite reductase/ring-hydroxylating ferredoxin subunit
MVSKSESEVGSRQSGVGRRGTRHVVANVADIPPGERLIVTINGRSIGVFNVDGRFYAVRNSCPHQGGELCLGSLVGLATAARPGEISYTREGEILRCPWHGWEFDLATGRSVFDPTRTRVKSYPVEVEELQAEVYPVEIERDRVVVILT